MRHEKVLLEPLPSAEVYQPAHVYHGKHAADIPIVQPVAYEPVVPAYVGKHRLQDGDEVSTYIGKHRADVPPQYRGKYVGADGVIISPPVVEPIVTDELAPPISTELVPLEPSPVPPHRERALPIWYALSEYEDSEGRALVYDLAGALNEYTKLAAARERSIVSWRASRRKVEVAREHYEELRLKAKEWLNEQLKEQDTPFQKWLDISLADDMAEARVVGAGIRFEAEWQSVPHGRWSEQRQKMHKFYDWWARQGGGEKFFSKHRLVGTAKKSVVLGAVGLPIGIVAGAVGAFVAGPVVGAVAAGGIARGVARGFLRGRIEKGAEATSVAMAQYHKRLLAQQKAIEQRYITTDSPDDTQIEYPESVTDVYAAATERGVERNLKRLLGGMVIGAATGLVGAYLGDLVHGAIWGGEHEPHVAPPSTEHPTSPPSTPAPSTPPTTPAPSVPPEHGMTGQSFYVEPGSGEIREIQEYATSHNYNIKPDDAFRIYTELYQEHGSNIIDLDGSGPDTYLIHPGDIGLSHPGTAHWYPGIEDELRSLLTQASSATTT